MRGANVRSQVCGLMLSLLSVSGIYAAGGGLSLILLTLLSLGCVLAGVLHLRERRKANSP